MIVQSNGNVRIPDLLEASKTFDEKKADTSVRVSEIQFTTGGVLVPAPVPIASPEYLADNFFQKLDRERLHGYMPSDHALDQILKKMLFESLYGTHAASLRAKWRDPQWPRGLFWDEMQEHLARYKRHLSGGGRGVDRWFIRLYEEQIRAVLAEGYMAFNNTDFLDAIERFTRNINYRIDPGSRVTPDDLVVKLIYTGAHGLSGEWRQIYDDSYAAGLRISTDETGQGSLRFNPLIQKGRCINTTVYMNAGFTMDHRYRTSLVSGRSGGAVRDSRISAKALSALVKDQLGQIFAVSQELMNEVMQAAEDEVPDPADVILNAMRAQGVPMDYDQEALIGSQLSAGARIGNRVNVMDAFSFAAHKARHDGKLQMADKLEEMSGVALAEPKTLEQWVEEGRQKREKSS